MKIPKSVFVLFKKYVFYTLAFTLVFTPFSYVASVHATPIYGTYPNQGLFKMSLKKTTSRGQIGMSSSRPYDADFITAYSSVKSSTTGYSEMPSTIWPTGFNMIQNNWTGTWNQYVDIMVNFQNRGSTISSGETFRSLATSDFCSIWGTTYPCGMRPTIIMNTYKWDPMASSSRQRLIKHETGHAVGMMDYCSADSIMNNGVTSPAPCNGGKWTAITGYLSTDRSAVNSVYR